MFLFLSESENLAKRMFTVSQLQYKNLKYFKSIHL
jgi:hypothetical protein